MLVSGTQVKKAFETLTTLETLGKARTARIEILKAQKDNPVLKAAFSFAYDWRRSFNEIFCSIKIKQKQESDYLQNWETFMALIHRLNKRELSFFQGMQHFYKFLACCDSVEQKFYCRIVDGDLQVGVSSGILTLIWPDLIPQWGLALTSFLIDKEHISFPIFVEPLIDGIRVGVSIHEGRAVACYPILDFIVQELEEVCSEGVFDCVLSTSTNFEITKSLLNCKTKSLAKETMQDLWRDLRLHIFDQVKSNIFFSATNYMDATPYFKRRENLNNSFQQLGTSKSIVMVPYQQANSHKELMELLAMFTDQGHVGVVIKEPDSPYRSGISIWQILRKD